MGTMSCYSISSPARFCEVRNAFETLDVIVDVDSGKVDFISEDKKNNIRLDLMGAAELVASLQKVTDSKHFRNALGKELSKHLGRLDAIDGAIP